MQNFWKDQWAVSEISKNRLPDIDWQTDHKGDNTKDPVIETQVQNIMVI